MVQSALVTTGLEPICIGSMETWQVQPWLNGVPWNLAGGSATLKLTDPNGVNTSFAGTISGGGAFYVWTVIGPAGTWVRSWTLTDSTGLVQVMAPEAMVVISSPS